MGNWLTIAAYSTALRTFILRTQQHDAIAKELLTYPPLLGNFQSFALIPLFSPEDWESKVIITLRARVTFKETPQNTTTSTLLFPVALTPRKENHTRNLSPHLRTDRSLSHLKPNLPCTRISKRLSIRIQHQRRQSTLLR